MPGENDPSHYVLPQQPFARCLLPQSFGQSAFRSVTNPYECEIDDKLYLFVLSSRLIFRFLGTSGQTISNLERYLVVEDKLDLMEKTLKSRHIAPTAPDQLGCYPFYDQGFLFGF